MLYSVPYEYIKRKVDVRVTDKTVEIFYNHNRIASHRRLYGRKGQYSTVTEHMPESHQQYLEWNGDRFRKWAERIGSSTCQVVDAILTSKRVEQQSYRSCMGLLNWPTNILLTVWKPPAGKRSLLRLLPVIRVSRTSLIPETISWRCRKGSSNKQPYRANKEQPCAYKRRGLLQEVRNHDHTKHDR